MKFDWTKKLKALRADGTRAYLMLDQEKDDGIIIITELEFDKAFTDEFGFDDEDRERLQEMAIGDKINLSNQWYVICSKINKEMLEGLPL